MNRFWPVFLGGFGLGVLFGLGLGVLEAPDSGERTRKKFAKKAERVKDTVSDQFKHFNAKRS